MEIDSIMESASKKIDYDELNEGDEGMGVSGKLGL